MISRDRLRRRVFMSLLGGAIAVWPLVTRGQQSGTRVIGFLGAASAGPWLPYVAAFRQGLGEAGYVEGRNVAIEFRWAEGRYERLPALAAELVRREVAVLVATGGAISVRAAMEATKTIPIIFTLGADPIEQGIAANLRRPAANATGVTMFTTDLPPKRLDLLHEVVPRAAKIAILFNPANPASSSITKRLEVAARSLNRHIFTLSASSARDLDAAFERMGQQRAGGLLIHTDPVFDAARAQIARLITRHAIPTMQGWREDVEAGGLISYGASLKDSYRQAGVYTAKILQGARPAELPILQPTKLELVINLKTAKALGIAIPPSLLARADEVIE